MTDGILGTKAAGGIGQDRVALQVQVIEDVAPLLVDQPFAADRYRRHLAITGRQAVAHELITGILPRSRNEPATERELAQDQRLVCWRLMIRCAASNQRDNLDLIA